MGRRPYLFSLVKKVKLWPSQNGILHGVEKVESLGRFIRLITYCGRTILVKDSRRSRAARWLRNRLMVTVCKDCHIPEWKIKRYSKERRST
ncbi:MAG: pyrrolysine--tRNA(Pyl) ligase small subunit [Candidatus Bathyarchaeota archaeon]|nr:pyrrolysine--tRNA(Pyl) ligase small subunit [Candidatus Bathyarchaeota archaeon]